MRNPALDNSIEHFANQIQDKEKEINLAMVGALKNHNREQAKNYFELALKYNEFYELCSRRERHAEHGECVKFLLDYWFLQDLITHLTPHADEEVVYVAGNDFGNLRMPYRICDLELEKQSPVYAKATAKSCSNVLINLCERGYQVQLVAHSHPGKGPKATCPSGIDINYLAKIQNAGSEAVGLIVTRDGYIRFFTVQTEYEISIKGKEVKHVAENVFKVPLV